MADVMRLPLPEPDDDAHPLDWYPEPIIEPKGLPGVLTETSYMLPEGLNIGEWLAIGETLQRMERSVMWWLGPSGDPEHTIGIRFEAPYHGHGVEIRGGWYSPAELIRIAEREDGAS